jgi:L-2-hydroxycarboxylate dehydrogenase (NAD+)
VVERIRVDRLTTFVAALFEAVGVTAQDSDTTSRRLVDADLRGRSGHGVTRVESYIERIEAGGINPRANVEVVDVAPAMARVDGDNGLGPVVMTRATETAIEKALAAGVGWVGTVRSNHAGAAGVYAAMAAGRGLVGLYMAVANANAMAPWGGDRKLLGTNPIAIAVPSATGRPFVLDIATTSASHGSIRVAADDGRPLPEGWVVDESGHPITDPARADSGLLVPMGGHKGAGLSIAIGLLAGVLNGAAFGSDVVDHLADVATPTNTGQVVVAVRTDLFVPADEALEMVAARLGELRSEGCRDGEVRLPGDKASERTIEQGRSGLILSEPLVSRLNGLGERLGVGPL